MRKNLNIIDDEIDGKEDALESNRLRRATVTDMHCYKYKNLVAPALKEERRKQPSEKRSNAGTTALSSLSRNS